MTDLRQAAQQALEALEFLQGGCTDSDDGTVEALTVWCPEVITALRKALEQPEQEPTPWRDMVVVSLVREGVNKHRARELADHFAAQLKQEPVAFYHPRNGFYWAKPTSIFAPTSVDVEPLPLYTAPPAAQRPWAGLEPEEILDLFDRNNVYGSKWIEFARTVEAKLKEKNNG